LACGGAPLFSLIAAMFSRMTRTTCRRIVFLLVANVILLITIALLLKEGASFRDVVERCGSDIAPILLAALALTGIIYAGAIDLSVGSIIALSGTLFGICVHHGFGPWLSFAVCSIASWALLALNGWMITTLKIPAIILTLAGLPLYRGLALILADSLVKNFSGNISIQDEAYHSPGKNYPTLLLLGGVVFALLLEQFGKTPRLWLALGNSEEACRLNGLSPSRILRSAFAVSGFFLALAALIFVTRIQAIEPARMALGFELQVIASVILGGTNIFGGEGSYLGTVLGALFLYLTSQVLIYAGASAYIQDALSGAIILAVIGIDCALHRKAKLMEELA
jgi:ribose/xylose/arabinose/galactoside ABC-type transport system permease subunit